MDFSEYKNRYFIRWQKKLLPACWLFFALAIVMTIFVSNYYFISGEIPRSQFALFLSIECIAPLSLHLISLIISTIYVKNEKKSPEKKMKFFTWMYFIQTGIIALFHSRFETSMAFPATSMILAVLLFDKRLLKQFFVLSLVTLVGASAIWLINFSQYTITHSIFLLITLVFLDVIVFLLSYYLCKLQRELIYSIFRSYVKHKKLNKELRLEPLTRLYNRTAYAKAVETLTRNSETSKFPLIQVLLDLDNFKEINDTYGHSGGDAVLITLGEMISNSFGKAKLGFRYGGDEFIMIFNDRSLEDAVETVEKLRTDFANTKFDFMKSSSHCSMSIGIAVYQPGWNSKQWFQAADAAAYVAKTNGKNRTEIAK